MDASTTLEIELSDPAHNFFNKKEYSYGEITICFLLLAILGVQLFALEEQSVTFHELENFYHELENF
jgi:hypothetical protein